MEEMILAGRITVNRMPADVGQKVSPGDEVRINGELVKVRFAEPRARVLMYHKPAGELVTRDDPEGRPTVFEKLPSIGNGKWINIGRLDYNTEGLLLFTNSGELANRMMHPRFEIEREYAVRVMGRLSDEQVQRLTSGIELDDGPARCERVEDGGGDDDGANHWYKVVLREGRNREVRRLFEALGLMVSRLIRTRYGSVAMPTVLKRGDLLELEPAAVGAVLAAADLRAEGGAPVTGDQGQRRDNRGGPKGVRPQGDRSGPRPQHAAGGQRQEDGAGRPHGRPGKRPFDKGPRPHAEHQPQMPHDADVAPDAPQVEHNPLAPAEPAVASTHEYDERQPLSNANAFPFGSPNAGNGASRGRPGGRPFGPGGRPYGQGGRPFGQAARPPGQGSGRPYGQGGRAQGQGDRPQGQGGRPQGQGGRPQGQGGRPQGQGGRPQGQGGRPQGQGGRSHGQGTRPPGQGGRPHGQGPRPPGNGPHPQGQEVQGAERPHGPPRPPQDGRPADPTGGPRKRNRRRGNRPRVAAQPGNEALPREETPRVDDES
jgi:23S rRNA pseudouridine2605 synthase